MMFTDTCRSIETGSPQMAKKYLCMTDLGGLSTMKVFEIWVRYDFSLMGGLRGVFVIVDRCCEMVILWGGSSPRSVLDISLMTVRA